MTKSISPIDRLLAVQDFQLNAVHILRREKADVICEQLEQIRLHAQH